MGIDQVAVLVGIDVGKSEHWAHAQDPSGKKLLDKALPNDEAKLRLIYQQLSEHGPVSVLVDQVSHHRGTGRGSCPSTGNPCGLPTRVIYAAYRRPNARQGQDRQTRRSRYRYRCPHHATPCPLLQKQTKTAQL